MLGDLGWRKAQNLCVCCCVAIGMRFPGSSRRRRRVIMYVYVLIIILLLQRMVGAIRVFPSGNNNNALEFSHRRSIIITDLDNKTTQNQEEDLFKKYFGGRTTFAPAPETPFDESKRRVPSCPDPLHN